MKVSVNGETREVSDDTALIDVIDHGAEAASRGVAVALDGAVVPRAQVATTTLYEGARVEVVTAVQGG